MSLNRKIRISCGVCLEEKSLEEMVYTDEKTWVAVCLNCAFKIRDSLMTWERETFDQIENLLKPRFSDRLTEEATEKTIGAHHAKI